MFRLVIRIFCLLTHTFLAHLTWLVSQRWSVASSLNQVFARKQHSQEASVCACVCKIHISLMTERRQRETGSSFVFRHKWAETHGQSLNGGHCSGWGFAPSLIETAPMSTHLRLCWQCSTADGCWAPDPGLYTRVWMRRLSGSVTIGPESCHLQDYESRMTGNKSPCRLLEAKSVPGWANGAVPAHRRICSGACITKQHDLSLGWTQV